MIRSRLACLKHVVYALTALVFLVCAVEVGLRVYDARTGGISDRGRGGRGLVVRSWLTHHSLAPLQTVDLKHPDTGETVRLVTNSHGLRGREIAVPKPDGVFRIVCLGDETLFAAELDESQTACARLEELLQQQTRYQVEVVNAAVPGYCPLLSYLQVKHSLSALQADVLVLSFDMSDVADDHGYRRHTQVGLSSLPLACLHPDLALGRPRRPNDLESRFLIYKWCRTRLGLLRAETDANDATDDRRDIDTAEGRYAWLRDNPPDWSIYIRQALSPIDELNVLARSAGAQLIVSVCPAPWQVSPEASNAATVRAAAGVPRNRVYRSREAFEILQKYLAERRIPCCDPSDSFLQVPRSDELYLRNAPRLSARGHELYARRLAEFLVKNRPGSGETGPSDRREVPPLSIRRKSAISGYR